MAAIATRKQSGEKMTQAVRVDQREPRLVTCPDPPGCAGEHALPRGERAPAGTHRPKAAPAAGSHQPHPLARGQRRPLHPPAVDPAPVRAGTGDQQRLAHAPPPPPPPPPAPPPPPPPALA